jgi:DnaJ-class molecular chaperone
MDTKTEKQVKEICKECRGNGFIRVPYHQAGEEQWADCVECDNQGEIVIYDRTTTKSIS